MSSAAYYNHKRYIKRREASKKLIEKDPSNSCWWANMRTTKSSNEGRS